MGDFGAIARIGFAIAGVVIGSAIGGPFGAAIGLGIAGIASAILFPPEDINREGPRLDSLTVTSSAVGKPIFWIFGTMRVGGNVVMSPGLVEHRIEETQSGKGGPEITTVSFIYTVSFRWNCCRGVVGAFLKVFGDGKLMVDRINPGAVEAGIDFEAPGDQRLRYYFGEETQLPDPDEEALVGIGNALAYRGTAGLWFNDLPVADWGNRIPQLSAIVTMSATQNFGSDGVDNDTGVALTGPGPQWYQSADRKFVWITDQKGEVLKIDTATQTYEFGFITPEGNDNNPGQTCGIDPVTGFLLKFEHWADTGSPGRSVRVYNLDGKLVGGTEPQQGVPSGAGDGRALMVAGAIAGPTAIEGEESTSRFIVAIWAANGMLSIYPFFADPELTESETFAPLICCGVAIQLGSQWQFQDGLAVDRDGYLWITYFNTSTADYHLVKLDPWSKIVIDDITLINDAKYLSYNEEDHSLIFQIDIAIGGNAKIGKFGLDTLLEEVLTLSAQLAPDGEQFSTFRNGPWHGRLYLPGVSGKVYEIDCTNWTVVDLDMNDYAAGSTIWEGVYDPNWDALLGSGFNTGNDTDWAYLGLFTGDLITPKLIVDQVSDEVELDSGTFVDSSALTADSFIGYAVDRRMTGRNVIEPLAFGFGFRSVSTERIIRFIKRGGASTFAIPESDMGVTTDPAQFDPPIKVVAGNEHELPLQVEIIYSNPSNDYQPGLARFGRPREAVTTRHQIEVQFPGAMDEQTAVRMAETMLFLAWLEQTTLEWSTHWQHLHLDGGDVGEVTADGFTHDVELISTDYGANGVVQMTAFAMDAEASIGAATGILGTGFVDQTLSITQPSILHILDSTLLRDQDEGLITYIAASGRGDPNYPGTVVYKSKDGGDTWEQWTAIPSSREAFEGFTTDVLPDVAEPNTWDRTGTVTIRLNKGTPASVSELAVLNGANRIMIGQEVVQYQTVTPNADGSFTLSKLLRGRKGTEWATGLHVVRERAVLLRADRLAIKPMSLNDFNISRKYKPVTIGLPFSQGTIEDFTFQAFSKKPWTVSHIRTTKEGNGDWTITWFRRSRYGNEWLDLIDTALNELSEDYRLKFKDGSDVLKETVNLADVKTFTWTVAAQIASFGFEQGSINVEVFQIGENSLEGFGKSGADDSGSPAPSPAAVTPRIATPTSGTQTDMAVPSGVLEDMQLVAVLAHEAAVTYTTPTGWILRHTGQVGGSNDATFVVYTRTATIADESTPTYSWIHGSSNHQVGCMMAYDGVHPGSPVETVGPGRTSPPNSFNGNVCAGANVSQAPALMVHCWCTDRGTNQGTMFAPPSFTQHGAPATGANGVSCSQASLDVQVTGETGDKCGGTQFTGLGDDWAAVMLILRPAP